MTDLWELLKATKLAKRLERVPTVSLADAVLTEVTKAKFVLTPTLAEGYETKAYGIIVNKHGDAMTKEEAQKELVLGSEYIIKTCRLLDGTPFTLRVNPIDDELIWAVGYITVSKDGWTAATWYTEPKSARVSELEPEGV